MKHIISIISVFFLLAFFNACDSSEDISYKMDHEVPSYKLLTDSLLVQQGQNVEIKVEISDDAGLSTIVFSYDVWSVRESFSLMEENYPKSYTFAITITIPDDAEKEWIEEVIRNDGSTVRIPQQYHKLNIEASDVNLNVRNIPVYIKVQ